MKLDPEHGNEIATKQLTREDYRIYQFKVTSCSFQPEDCGTLDPSDISMAFGSVAARVKPRSLMLVNGEGDGVGTRVRAGVVEIFVGLV